MFMNINVTASKTLPLKVLAISLIASAFCVTMIIYHVRNGDEATNIIYSYWLTYTPLFILSFSFTVVSLSELIRISFIKSAVLSVQEDGIIDNLTLFSCGNISWAEIAGIRIINFRNVDVLVIEIADPHELIKRQSFFFKRRALTRRLNRWNSPVVIPGKRVNYDLQKLKDLLASAKYQVASTAK
jgi:hypothetical protein